MDQLVINTIRALAIDMTNEAKSGHPGMPLGSAPIGYKIFKEMKINPKKPDWFNRDRFVLASGHASTLLYSLLHLSGYNICLTDLKNFRQLDSITPGHPEYLHTAGVDATSGPLGQGIAMAVGMALAETVLASKYNKEDYNIIDHYTYVLCGDGDMQEGVTFEASSLAGLWKLGKLIVFYDSNDVTLDGPLNDTSSDNIKNRYESMGWQYLYVADGNDLIALDKALKMAQLEDEKPTLIEVKTIIGYGSQKQGTSATHGAPLGQEDGTYAKEFYGCSLTEFDISNEIYDTFTYQQIKQGEKQYKEWLKQLKKYQEAYPQQANELQELINDDYRINYGDYKLKKTNESQATRNSSNDVINYLATKHPTFMGGSADLSSSTMTKIKDSSLFSATNRLGRNINYGIREFAMAVINNGVILHGGIKIFGGTFFVFSDYLKPALKMAALMKIPTINVFSHDSIAVGEDGPTHQPIEHLAMLRSMPNLNVIRPCDANETFGAWQIAMESKQTPSALILSRQNLMVEANSDYNKVKYGAYVIKEEREKVDCLLIATGSEVNLAIAAATELEKDGYDIRVVSMPCRSLFEQQSKKYQNQVIPTKCKQRLVIEMATSYGWHKYALKDNQILGIDTYGLSAKGSQVMDYYGFNVDNVVKLVKTIVK
ncbi:transketolase [Erysipelotrichaceae bacterium OttesenSCG-928-M19]|nr:transketolase [Erysipelotrichaceae bacterium OttesenSCG-928-M19]